jgi:hypothetical protein
MKLKLTFIAIFSAIGFNSFAQQTEKASLESISAPSATAFTVTDSAATKTAEAKTLVQMPKKVSFSLAAGTMFGSNGMATYLAPSMYYRLNSRFSLFTGVTYLNSSFSPYHSESLQPMATKHYLVNVGGMYQVSDKLQVSGSVWRDFSNMSNQFGNSNNLRQPNRYGTEFNATYKVNDVLTIHGGIRTSNGNPYYNNYNSAFGPATPFRY